MEKDLLRFVLVEITIGMTCNRVHFTFSFSIGCIDLVEKDKIIIDSLKGELDIEIFEKSRYISIVEQVSEVNCKEVKEIIDGTE